MPLFVQAISRKRVYTHSCLQLFAEEDVAANELTKLNISIADVSDGMYDSVIFLEAQTTHAAWS